MKKLTRRRRMMVLMGGGSGGGGSFTPTDISGLSLWLDASDAATVINTAGAVDQWDDKSGNNYDATALTTKRPTTGTRTINSLNALDFDGTTDWMDVNSGLYAISNAANTVFICFASDNTGDATQCLFNGINSGGGSRYGVSFTATTVDVQNRTTTSALTSQAHTRDTATTIVGLNRSGVDIYPFVNGVKGTAGTNSENFTSTTLTIGSQNSVGANRVNGLIAEIIVYNSALSDADMNRVGGYLATKWAATWTGF